MNNLFYIKSLVICLVICISFLVYTTRLLDCDIIRWFQCFSLIMQTLLALLSCALLLPRAIVLRAIVLRAFVTARICLRAFVGAVLSCALLSGHRNSNVVQLSALQYLPHWGTSTRAQ